MCGRYFIPEPDDDSGFKAILAHIEDAYKESPLLSKMKLGEIFPASIVPVLTDEAPVLMKWGFSRFDGKDQVINARLESADEKPMFKKAYAASRCLVPAAYYFEWQKDGTLKHKYAIGTGEPIYMAGLFRSEPDTPLPLFVIITRPAAPDIAFIHDRMPVIVPEPDCRKWLTERISPNELLELSDEQLKYKAAV